MRPPRLVALVALALSAGLAGCATNPATGQLQLSLVSEAEEIELGKEAAQDVRRSVGLYADPALQAYVEEVGRALAARSERPALPWTFGVADDAAINAFALPGGHVYVTRGILAHLASEAELATILGHEIGHVTARHSAAQISRAKLAQLGLGIGSVLLPESLGALGQLAGAGAQLLFLKFGRDDENQADELGFRYARAAGYDPGAMVGVFRMLSRAGGTSGGRLPGWLSTHPDPESRLQRAQARLAGGAAGGRVDSDAYLRRVVGLPVGDDPRHGFFVGSSFRHPDLRFRFDFPEGWTVRNRPAAVVGVSPERDAAIVLALVEAASPAAAAQQLRGVEGIQAGPPAETRVNGLAAVQSLFSARTEQGTLAGLATFVAHEGRTYRVLAFAPEARAGGHEAAFRRAASSFAPLTDPAALRIEPARLALVTLPRAMTLAEFQQAYPSSLPLDRLALLNRVEAGETIPAGRVMKRVVGGPGAGG